MIAVPYEAFEAVREEPDMGGRVWHLKIESWSVEELLFIARTGFGALNVADDVERLASVLSDTSFGAPFLMQQLCYDLVSTNGVQATQAQRKF